jgi:hypothetical protein
MELNNDLPGGPPSALSEWALAERVDAAVAFWGSVGVEVDNSLIRDFGMDAWCAYQTPLFHSHHRRFFLPGLEKLGISDTLPDVVRSALYHGRSNALGGLRTKNFFESDTKAWIFYYPPTGATGGALLPDGYWRGIFSGWHANNGRSLGNPGVVFVNTHLVSRGDPYDGGYFLDTGENVPDGQHFRTAFDEAGPPSEAHEIPQVADDTWPEERRIKAYRNFSVWWAWDRMASALEHFGSDAQDSVRHGCEVAIYAFLPIYRRAVGGTGPSLAAGYVQAVHEIAGWDVTRTEDNGSVTVTLDRDPVKESVESLSDELLNAAWDGVTGAWAGLARHVGAGASRESSSDLPSWAFTETGH